MDKHITRRCFLRKSLKVGAGIWLASGVSGFVGRALGDDAGSVRDLAVAEGDAREAVREAIEGLGGIERFVKSGDRVLIKPNISFPNPPEWATTTDPSVMRAVAELCLDAGASRVVIADHPLGDAGACRKRVGVDAALEGLDRVSLLMLDRERLFTEIEIPDGKELKKTAVAKIALKSDVLVSVPVAKSHSATTFSGSIKGLMGLVWDRGVMHQADLDQAIADLSTVVKSDLVVIDATKMLVSGGPSGPGKVARAGTVIAGTDPVKADLYAVKLAERHGLVGASRGVRHLALAEEMGL